MRYNLARMYAEATEQAATPAQQRDYQHFQGRAANREALAQQLIDSIEQALAALAQ